MKAGRYVVIRAGIGRLSLEWDFDANDACIDKFSSRVWVMVISDRKLFAAISSRDHLNI